MLCERGLATDDRTCYLLHVEAIASRHDLVRLARSRWPVEQKCRELKDDLGFDHFEGRAYRGCTHYVVLTAIAFTFFQCERLRCDDAPRPTLPRLKGRVREIFAALYVIGTATYRIYSSVFSGIPH